MEVSYADRTSEKLATDIRAARRELGKQGAEGLGKRIKQLESAETLADVLPAPGKWHWLKHDLAGCMGATIHSGWRLVVTPNDGDDNPPNDATDVTVQVTQHYDKK